MATHNGYASVPSSRLLAAVWEAVGTRVCPIPHCSFQNEQNRAMTLEKAVGQVGATESEAFQEARVGRVTLGLVAMVQLAVLLEPPLAWGGGAWSRLSLRVSCRAASAPTWNPFELVWACVRVLHRAVERKE